MNNNYFTVTWPPHPLEVIDEVRRRYEQQMDMHAELCDMISENAKLRWVKTDTWRHDRHPHIKDIYEEHSLDKMKKLAEQLGDILSTVSTDYIPAIQRAVTYDDLEVATMLLENGATPNACYSDQENAFEIAIDRGNQYMIELLAYYGGIFSPMRLHSLCRCKDRCYLVKSIRYLLNNGADPNKEDEYSGVTPLMIAAVNSSLETVQLLFEHGADITRIAKCGNYTALIDAVLWNRKKMVKYLVQQKGIHKIIDVLDGRWGHTPLIVACMNGYTDIVSYLIYAGANVNIEDAEERAPLYISIVYERYDIVKMLLKAGAYVNWVTKDKGYSCIHGAAIVNDSSIMYSLLRAGANPDIQDKKKNTALHVTCINNHDTCTRALLQYKANPNIQDTKGDTPLIHACDAESEECVRILLHYNADPNIASNTNMTALHSACDSEKMALVKLLVEAGADINAQCFDHTTPIMMAVDHPDQVRYLLSKGANIHLVNRNGLTALDYTYEFLNDEEYEHGEDTLKNTYEVMDILTRETNWNERKYVLKLPESTGIFGNLPIDLLPYIASFLGAPNKERRMKELEEMEEARQAKELESLEDP
jgi:ankyrin repeat protein